VPQKKMLCRVIQELELELGKYENTVALGVKSQGQMSKPLAFAVVCRTCFCHVASIPLRLVAFELLL